MGARKAVVALSEVRVDIVAAHNEARFRDLMQARHYLGALPRIGETVRYVLHRLCRGARARLRAADLDPRLRQGVAKMTLSAGQMQSLPEIFLGIDDPRRRQGRRHALPTVLALATAATLCGMCGYKAINEWVDDLRPRVLQRFRVRRRDSQYRLYLGGVELGTNLTHL